MTRTPAEPARAAGEAAGPADASAVADALETIKATGTAASPGAAARPTRGSRYRVIGEGDTFVISALTVLALCGLWWSATRFGWIKPLFLPSPASTWHAFSDALQGHTPGQAPLLEHVLVSVLRVFSAFLLAVLTAVPVGIAMGVSRVARGVFDPVVEFYRPLPPLAYLPLIVIWLGIDESAKVTLIYLACFAPLAMAAKAGVRAVPIEQINAAYTLGATRWQVITAVILPAALPEILTGMRIAIGFGWTTLVAAEMVAATLGLGQMVLNASNFLRTDIVVMGIILIGIIAYGFDLLMRLAEAKLTPWKGRL